MCVIAIIIFIVAWAITLITTFVIITICYPITDFIAFSMYNWKPSAPLENRIIYKSFFRPVYGPLLRSRETKCVRKFYLEQMMMVPWVPFLALDRTFSDEF